MKCCVNRVVWFVVVVVVVAGWLPGEAAGRYAEEIKRIEDLVARQMKMERTPGLSIGFMKGDFVWAKGFGYADLENKTPATSQSAYRLASVTKPMTAVAVLQLVEKGKIDLDAEARKYVPYFPRKHWPVTVRHLLGHLGGISHYRDYDAEGHIKVNKDTREAIAIFEDFELVAEPGTRYNYSSYGYNLLGAIIEGAAKQPYGDYMREHIWQPLGMSHTFMDNPEALIPGRVRGYQLMDGEIKNSEYVDISSRFAGGGTRSTVVDLLKFARGIIDKKLLSAETTDSMLTPMANREGFFTGYGMGWSIFSLNGHFAVGHGGAQAETRTDVTIFPQEDFAIAVACNFEDANPRLYTAHVYRVVSGEPWYRPLYTEKKADDILLSALDGVFSEGSSYFERYQKPLGSDQAAWEEAFSLFNQYVNPEAIGADHDAALKKIRAGEHPKGKQWFVKVGSLMAMKLKEKFGSARLDTYHRQGAIAFFHDYIEMYRQDGAFPQTLRLNDGLVQSLKQFRQGWQETGSMDIRRLVLLPDTDWEAVGKKLKKTFADTAVCPDFSRDLARVVVYYYINGKKVQALKVARLAADLYPRSALPLVMLAHTHACFAEKDEAAKLYDRAKATEFDKGNLGPRGFAYYARNLAAFGKAAEALTLLQMGAELHPQSAVLHYYLGIAYQEKAARHYRQALRLDPSHEDARKRLKKVE
jgi:CubicO group peptidase (beta-lactamase class C family)/tetratricopeptide (TPR) repeat protein